MIGFQQVGLCLFQVSSTGQKLRDAAVRSLRYGVRIEQLVEGISGLERGAAKRRGTAASARIDKDDVAGPANAAGKVVILAHGASIPLAGMPGLLRVLITGSPAVRAARLAKADGVGDARAKKAVQDSDRERRDFLQRFYRQR